MGKDDAGKAARRGTVELEGDLLRADFLFARLAKMAMRGDPSADGGLFRFRLRLHEEGSEGVVGGDLGEQRRVGRYGVGGLAVDDQIDQRGADLARVGLRPKETELAVDVADFDGEAGGDCHRRRQTAWSGARSSSAWRGPQDPAG